MSSLRRALRTVWDFLGEDFTEVCPCPDCERTAARLEQATHQPHPAVLHAERRAATDHAGEVRPQPSTFPAGASDMPTSPACLPCAAKDRRIADLEADLLVVRAHRHRIEDDRLHLIHASAAADPGPAPTTEETAHV